MFVGSLLFQCILANYLYNFFKNDAFDSDDSEYDANFIDDEEDGEGNYQPQRPKIPAEDIETVIKAGNIVPKPLPQVTPDANPQPAGYPGYRYDFLRN